MPDQNRNRRPHVDNTPEYIGGYTERYPGILMILIDQSRSMGDDWHVEEGGEGAKESKATVAASAVNTICRELVGKCREEGVFLKKAYLSVVGYGSDDSGDNPQIDTFCNAWINEVAHRWWEGNRGTPRLEGMIQPYARGGTPMAPTFYRAAEIMHSILGENEKIKKSLPPTVINITDGRADDYRNGNKGRDTILAADDLCDVSTELGSLTLINIYIDPNNKGEVLFELPIDADEYAQFLYHLSSPLPKYMRARAAELRLGRPSDDARAFVITRRPETLVKILRWGSMGRKVD